MTADAERAALLAEQAAGALFSARASLSEAADALDEVGVGLRRAEDDLRELSDPATLVRHGEEPERQLREAGGLADGVDERFRRGRLGLNEVRDHLDQGDRSLRAGRRFLTELEQLPGQQDGVAAGLRTRVEGLDRAVRDAREGVEEADRRLGSARNTLEPLVYASGGIDDRARTAAWIDAVQAAATNDVMAVQRRLTGLHEDLGAAQPQVTVAARQGADLATTTRAALNPTPATHSHPAGASATQLRPRPAGAEQGADLDR